jgi:hypothetical protein
VAYRTSPKRDAPQPACLPGLRMTCGADGVLLVELHDGAGWLQGAWHECSMPSVTTGTGLPGGMR